MGDLGGLNDAFNLIIQPLISLVLPSLFTRSILVEGNFKYDGYQENENNRSRNEISKRSGRAVKKFAITDSKHSLEIRKKALVEKLRSEQNRLSQVDIMTLKKLSERLIRYSVTICTSLLA